MCFLVLGQVFGNGNSGQGPIDSHDYTSTLYGHTESGCLSLLGFEGANGCHIIPVIGHTFNDDSWLPLSNKGYFQKEEMKYYSSGQWLDSHIIHDDNYGPYYCMPRYLFPTESVRLLYGISIDRTSLYSNEAEIYATFFLKEMATRINYVMTELFVDDTSRWLDLFIAFARAGYLVLRAVFMDKNRYLTHLKDICVDSSSTLFANLVQVLPGQFWMVEASMPELFSVSRRKFGEIIFLPDSVCWTENVVVS